MPCCVSLRRCCLDHHIVHTILFPLLFTSFDNLMVYGMLLECVVYRDVTHDKESSYAVRSIPYISIKLEVINANNTKSALYDTGIYQSQ